MAAPIEKTNVVTAIVYDFETGGKECDRCAATQVSLHAVRLDTFEVTGKYSAYIYPYNKKATWENPGARLSKASMTRTRTGGLWITTRRPCPTHR